MRKCKNRHSWWFRTIAMVAACLFLFNNLTFGLAPRLRTDDNEFQGFKKRFEKGYNLLAHKAVNEYIRKEIEKAGGFKKLTQRNDIINLESNQKLPIIITSIPGLFANTGQFAHVGLGKWNKKPVIYVDSEFYYDEEKLVEAKKGVAEPLATDAVTKGLNPHVEELIGVGKTTIKAEGNDEEFTFIFKELKGFSKDSFSIEVRKDKDTVGYIDVEEGYSRIALRSRDSFPNSMYGIEVKESYKQKYIGIGRTLMALAMGISGYKYGTKRFLAKISTADWFYRKLGFYELGNGEFSYDMPRKPLPKIQITRREDKHKILEHERREVTEWNKVSFGTGVALSELREKVIKKKPKKAKDERDRIHEKSSWSGELTAMRERYKDKLDWDALYEAYREYGLDEDDKEDVNIAAADAVTTVDKTSKLTPPQLDIRDLSRLAGWAEGKDFTGIFREGFLIPDQIERAKDILRKELGIKEDELGTRYLTKILHDPKISPHIKWKLHEILIDEFQGYSRPGLECGSPAACLDTIRDDESLLKKARSREGFSIKDDLKLKRLRKDGETYSWTTIYYREIKPLEDLGILVPVEGEKYRYRFSGMMLGPSADYTKRLINAVNDIRYQVGKRGEQRPLYRADIQDDGIPAVKKLVKMTILHEIRLMQKPHIPEGKVLWHILENSLLPQLQRGSFAQKINNASRKSKNPERIWIARRGRSVEQEVEYIKSICPGAIFDVALSSAEHIEKVPVREGKDKIKMLVFEGKPGDFRQIEGIITALQALHLPKEQAIPALSRIYQIITGSPYEGKLPPASAWDKPRDFARYFIFNLPPVATLPIDDIPKLNTRLLAFLISA